MATAIPLDNGPRPLFARIMGSRFDLLPPVVRRIHSGEGLNAATGEAIVVRGRNPLTAIVAAVFGFPPAGLHRVCVTFAASATGERWTRDFGGHCFSSRLSEAGDRMIERFGPYRFSFDLVSEDGGLSMRMTNWSFAGVPLPMRLAPHTVAREWQQDGAFHFHVALALPVIGDVVSYSGWLKPDTAETA